MTAPRGKIMSPTYGTVRQTLKFGSLLVALAGELRAQPAASAAPTAALSWMVEGGASYSTPFVEDGNGVFARAGVGPYLRIGASRGIFSRTRATAGLRADAAALRLRSSASAWRAGTTRRLDVHAGLEVDVTPRVTALAGLLGARASGPDDVIPFRTHRGALWTWGMEAGAVIPVDRRRRTAITVVGEATRMAAQPSENPRLAGGAIGRVRIGVRHALR